MRTPLPEVMMLHAEVARLRSTCPRPFGQGVGAVVAKGDLILGTGYNGPAKGEDHCECGLAPEDTCEAAVHAEDNAIIHAGRGSESTIGATLYTTLSPCHACAGRIINAGIVAVYYQQEYKDPRGLLRLRMRFIPVHHWPMLRDEADYPTMARVE